MSQSPLRILLYGATGMVGQGVLRECLLDADVASVLAIGRGPTGRTDPKLREIVLPDFLDYSRIEAELTGYNACLFCLGVSAVGMSEPEYTRIVHDYPLAAARALARLNPGMTFIYVSGQGTDSTEKSRMMWARIKGRTENELLAMPFKAVYAFRPGYIQPLHGARSRDWKLRLVYAVMGPLYPLWRRIFPGWVTTSESVGRAMLHVAGHGAKSRVLENSDINALGGV